MFGFCGSTRSAYPPLLTTIFVQSHLTDDDDNRDDDYSLPLPFFVLQREDERMRQLVRGTRYVCTGFAFATFNTELAAARCLEVPVQQKHKTSGSTLERGAEKVV